MAIHNATKLVRLTNQTKLTVSITITLNLTITVTLTINIGLTLTIQNHNVCVHVVDTRKNVCRDL